MPNQLTTSTQAAALGYAPQNKIAQLCDGTYIWVDESGASTNTNKLYQITTPGGTPTNTQVTGMVQTITGGTQCVSDIYVLNNGTTTSDVWVVTSGQAGGAGVKIQHGLYTASGSTWSWDTSTTVPILGTTAGEICAVCWTGTYLIVGWRDASSTTFSIRINYTTTKNGTAGWLTTANTVKLNTKAGTVSHQYISLFHDATSAATIAVYTQMTGANGTEFITARVLSDAFSPALANWGPEASFGGSLNVGGGNFSAAYDHTAGLIAVWCDSTASNTRSPGFCMATIAVDAVTVANNLVTWGTMTAIGTASTAAASPKAGFDGSGKIFVFWETAAANATGNVSYATISSPYTSASAVTALTSTGANYYPHIPMRQRFSNGYVPLIYQTATATPFGIQYDNSIVAGVGSTAWTAALTETQTVTSAITRLFAGIRNDPSTVNVLTDLPGRVAAYFRNDTSTVNVISDLPSRLVGFFRNDPGTVNIITDFPDRVGSFFRNDPNTVNVISDLPARALSLARAAYETTGVSDIANAARVFIRAVVETVSNADVAVRSLVLSRNDPSTVNVLTDSPNRVVSLTRLLLESITSSGAAQALKPGAPPMTMTSDTTASVSWTSPSSGSDTETNYNAQNAAGDGVRFGANPSYGGMPFSKWSELVGGAVVNAGMNSVNPGSQISMATSTPDGHMHVLVNTTTTTDGSFAGSENKSFTLTEQAPTQTLVRRYLKTSTVTVNGLQYTFWACLWPSDPMLIAWRIDMTAASTTGLTSAGSTDNIEVCSPAGMLSNTGTGTNQGVWNIDSTHSFYGTVSGSTTGTIPDGTTANTAGEPDFLALLPVQGVGSLTNQRLGVMTVKFTKWSDIGLTASGFASLQNTNRVKAKWGAASGTSLPSGTYTLYLLEAIKSSLTTAVMAAIAADYLAPGAPTVSLGTLTTFNYPNHTAFPFNLDEAAYVVNCASNQAAITLDLTPAHVTTRYCPRFKLTNYTASGKPVVLWGGTRLSETVDYNVTVDTTNHVCYLQLQRDVVASGASGSQLNSATLTIESSWVLSLTDLIGVGDVVTHLSVLARMGTDIVTSVDADGRTVMYTRIQPETTAASDTPNRVLGVLRQLLDSSLAQDAASRATGVARSVIGTVASSEVITAPRSLVRAVVDSVSNLDLTARAVSFGRQAGEILGASDAAAVARALLRAVLESTTSNGIPARSVEYVRQVIEVITSGDAPDRIVGVVRQVFETITSNETVTGIRGLVRTAVESVTSGDLVDRIVGALRTAAETTGLTDAANRAQNLTRAAQESIASNDAASRAVALARRVVETITTSDIATAIKNSGSTAWIAAVTGASIVTDVTARQVNALRQVFESASASDLADRATGLVRQAFEAMTSSDAANRAVGFARAAIAAVLSGDAANRLVGVLRTVSDAVTQSDLADRIRGIFRQTTETEQTPDQPARSVGFFRSVVQTIQSADIAGRSAGAVRQVVENVTSSDLVDRVRGLTVTALETVGVVAVASRAVGIVRAVADATHISDLIRAISSLIIAPVKWRTTVEPTMLMRTTLVEPTMIETDVRIAQTMASAASVTASMQTRTVETVTMVTIVEAA
jgi:hypothetical protein